MPTNKTAKMAATVRRQAAKAEFGTSNPPYIVRRVDTLPSKTVSSTIFYSLERIDDAFDQPEMPCIDYFDHLCKLVSHVAKLLCGDLLVTSDKDQHYLQHMI